MKSVPQIVRQMSWIVPLGALVVGGCTVGPDYKRPDMKVPQEFSEMAAATQPTTQSTTAPTTQPVSMDAQPRDYEQWWTTFNDPQLNSLIARAVANNPDVIAAEARIREARATLGVVTSGLFPSANLDGNFTHSRQSSNLAGLSSFSQGGGFPGIESDLWKTGFDMSWEIDVFGGTRRAIESAKYSVQAAVWDRRDVLVSLLAEVAVNYVELRGVQRELIIARHNLDSQQQTLNLTRSKAEGGLIPYLDVAQQEAQVATTAATIPTFEAEERKYVHHLGILLGQDPGSLSAELAQVVSIPVGPTYLPPGLPSELMRRRPDVRRAERQLAAATAEIGVATADMFPKFSVTGALGVESQSLKKLFDHASRYYNIEPGATWDIFDAGKVNSNIKVQNARQIEALETYRKAVLQSMQDVDDSLVAYNREQVRLQSLRTAVTANQRAVDLSTELFQKGSADFLSVLDAQRNLFAAQDAQVQSEQAVSTNLVALYKALGGGWEREEAAATQVPKM